MSKGWRRNSVKEMTGRHATWDSHDNRSRETRRARRRAVQVLPFTTTMPPHRTPRSRPVDATHVDADSDDGGDTDYEGEPTPKPQRRKRVSEAAFDASFTSDSGRLQAQKSVNINDDAAEKRRRRKSARPVVLNDDPEAGPSTEDTRAAAHARQKQQLLSVAEAPAIDVPLDVMNQNFEEWMKMATDNVRLYSKLERISDYFSLGYDRRCVCNSGDQGRWSQRVSLISTAS